MRQFPRLWPLAIAPSTRTIRGDASITTWIGRATKSSTCIDANRLVASEAWNVVGRHQPQIEAGLGQRLAAMAAYAAFDEHWPALAMNARRGNRLHGTQSAVHQADDDLQHAGDDCIGTRRTADNCRATTVENNRRRHARHTRLTWLNRVGSAGHWIEQVHTAVEGYACAAHDHAREDAERMRQRDRVAVGVVGRDMRGRSEE